MLARMRVTAEHACYGENYGKQCLSQQEFWHTHVFYGESHACHCEGCSRTSLSRWGLQQNMPGYCEGFQQNKLVMLRPTCMSQWESCLLPWGLQQNMLVTVGVTLVTIEVTAWTCSHDSQLCHILKYKSWGQGLAQTLTPKSSGSLSSRNIAQHLMNYSSTPIAPSNEMEQQVCTDQWFCILWSSKLSY